MIKISTIKSNPNNPRLIKDDKFRKLVNSIKEFPKMMELRPMVVNEDMMLLGGNMRLKALIELGYKEIPNEWLKKASELTEEEQKRFIIADNIAFGEHDWDVLANEWDAEQLEEWGLDLPESKELNESDLFDIEIPFYTPSEIVPDVFELADLEKTKVLIDKIEQLNITEDLKEILKIRASFFTDFNFQKIADFYSNQQREIKEVFEDLGMVILAPKEALEKGFVQLSENIFDI